MRVTSIPDVALTGEKICSIGYIFLPSFLLYFALVFVKRDELFSKRFLLHGLIFIPPAVFLVPMLLSNVLIERVVRTSWGFTAVLGPSYFGFAVYQVGFLAIAFQLILKAYLQSNEKRIKNEALFIQIGIAIPFFGGSITDIILPLLGKHPFELGFILTAFSGIAIGYAIAKHKLMILDSSLTAKVVLSTMASSLFVANSEKKITMLNKSMLDLLGYKHGELLGRKIDTVWRDSKIIDENLTSGQRINDYHTFLLAKNRKPVPVSVSLSVLLDEAGTPIGSVGVAEDLRKMQTYLTTVTSLAETVDARDTSTAGHSRRVRDLSISLANMLQLNSDFMRELEIAALLHDIGKVGIRDKVLFKPGPLNEAEWRQIKTHPLVAVRILEPIPFLREMIPIIRYHHERFDGHGYPAALVGSEIPLGARIIAVADSFDAMASARHYRPALTSAQIFNELVQGRGTQFDPELLDLFLTWLREYELEDVLGKSADFHEGLQDLTDEQVELLISKLLIGNQNEVEERIARSFIEISGNLFDELKKLAGFRICETIGGKLNEFSKQNGAPFYVGEGRVRIEANSSFGLDELIEEYRKFFLLLSQSVSDVVGKRLFDRMLMDALAKHGEAVKLLYTEYLLKDKKLPVYKGVAVT